MMRIFDIIYYHNDSNIKTGILELSDDNKYKAIRTNKDLFLQSLFGFKWYNEKDIVEDKEFRLFLKQRATPLTREDINDWLRINKIPYYDPELIFFATKGRDVMDRFEFVERK